MTKATWTMTLALTMAYLPVTPVDARRALVPLAVNPQCPDLCPIAGLRSGGFEMRTSTLPGTNGLVFRVRMEGLRFDTTVDKLVPVVALSLGGRACVQYTGPAQPVLAGRLKGAFSGGETIPPTPISRGVIRLCGVGFQLEGGDGALVIDGMLLPFVPADGS